MPNPRRSGILCHPTSMPGRFGIGGLGRGAFGFVDFLVEAGQTLWQILPLGPTGYGDSPYQSFSAFAGNPLLIDLDQLLEQGLLRHSDLEDMPAFDPQRVDYGATITWRDQILRGSFSRLEGADKDLRDRLHGFHQANGHWLTDYSLFMALKRRFDGAVWTNWGADIARYEAGAIDKWRDELSDEIAYQCYLQGLFDLQWRRLRTYANDSSVHIIGDVPIFVGHDSVDVWSNQDLFQLDEGGHPRVVAGVPPDYFSPTGQLWGTPHYRWERMRDDGYRWWFGRLRSVFDRVDIARLDHFRGFSGYWEVPAGEATAVGGRWVRGPGKPFFEAIAAEFGELPIIAEDLGLISADVDELRRDLGLPGMRVLQFAFDADACSPHLPHNYDTDCVAYSGTHDNDTTMGWYAVSDSDTQDRLRVYAGTDGSAPNWTLIRLAMSSVADTAIFPLQDLLGLGSEARLNTPGRASGNWTWRYAPDMLKPELAAALRQLSEATGRWHEDSLDASAEGLVIIEYADL